jgi:sulfite exporter TauE/SafE
MDLQTVLAGGTGVTMVIAVVWVLTQAGLPSRFAPIAAIVLAVIGSVLVYFQAQLPWLEAVFAGLTVGLVACGAYSATRTVANK